MALLAASATAQEWQIDPAHSTASFSVRNLLVTTVHGTFRPVRGTAVYDPANVSKSTITAEVQAVSVDTRNAERDQHLRSADFFDVANHPLLRFQSASIEPAGAGKLTMTGDLTIRGVTRRVVFEVQIPGDPVRDAQGVERLAATATTSVKRKDFGMTWNRLGFAIGNNVDITVNLQLVRRAAAR